MKRRSNLGRKARGVEGAKTEVRFSPLPPLLHLLTSKKTKTQREQKKKKLSSVPLPFSSSFSLSKSSTKHTRGLCQIVFKWNAFLTRGERPGPSAVGRKKSFFKKKRGREEEKKKKVSFFFQRRSLVSFGSIQLLLSRQQRPPQLHSIHSSDDKHHISRHLSSPYLPQQVDGGVGGAPGADVARERERRRRAGVDALRVEVADVDLDGGVVLGGDELVGPRAGDVVEGWSSGFVRKRGVD